jgi:hypothetical protein
MLLKNDKEFIHVFAAYLKMSISLLNSNQQDNLIFEKCICFLDCYNIVIILTNVD